MISSLYLDAPACVPTPQRTMYPQKPPLPKRVLNFSALTDFSVFNNMHISLLIFPFLAL